MFIANNYQFNTSYQENVLPAIHIKIHHTSPVLSPGRINFATLFRVC